MKFINKYSIILQYVHTVYKCTHHVHTLSVSQKAASGLEVPSFDTNFRLHKSSASSGSFEKGKIC